MLMTSCVAAGVSGGVFADTTQSSALAASSESIAAVPDWLSQSAASTRRYELEGVLVYQRGTVVETVQVSHRQSHDGWHDALDFLSGRPRGWRIADEAHVSGLVEGEPLPALDLDRQLAAGLRQTAIRQWQDDYRVMPINDRRIAGRLTRCVSIQPLDTWRWGREMCADRETGVILRKAITDSLQHALESYEFAEVTMTAAANRDRHPPVEPLQSSGPSSAPGGSSSESLTTHRTTKRVLPESLHGHFGWLPDGFYLQHLEPVQLDARRRALRAFYSDGLGAFSVFFEPARQAPLIKGVHQVGASVALVRTIVNADGALAMTLVGELPATSAHRILQSWEAGREAPHESAQP
ncbi:MucB/RseB C-terminal domain-containing protein [Terasakiispira papahanaumokuakeensis]|nr:MucB/RseB C-terminal domain-containing protein [Terasakiispira papahanaumokuakeensis]